MSSLDRASDPPEPARPRSRRNENVAVIVAAAEQLMALRGSSFTIQEVTQEAGVAIQTFYRCFESKDRLLLAVFEEMIVQATERYRLMGEQIADPVDRLRMCVTAGLEGQGGEAYSAPQFITAEYWRLYELFPEEMCRATQPFVDFGAEQLQAATAAGLLRSDDPASDAWLIAKLVMAIYHHRAFAPFDPPAADAKERVWAFCLAALGGHTST